MSPCNAFSASLKSFTAGGMAAALRSLQHPICRCHDHPPTHFLASRYQPIPDEARHTYGVASIASEKGRSGNCSAAVHTTAGTKQSNAVGRHINRRARMAGLASQHQRHRLEWCAIAIGPFSTAAYASGSIDESNSAARSRSSLMSHTQCIAAIPITPAAMIGPVLPSAAALLAVCPAPLACVSSCC